jgi:hypothetical protein
MPPLPDTPGLYLWECDGAVVYVGQTTMPLRARLGSQRYATISNYNTFAREPGRKNGGQQTNCRVNNLANQALAAGTELAIWYRLYERADVRVAEPKWMADFGVPSWNRRIEASISDAEFT